MNEKNLTCAELVRFGFGEEIVIRAREGKCYIADSYEEVWEEVFEAGRAHAKEEQQDDFARWVADMLNGELWQETLTEDQRTDLLDDLIGMGDDETT